MTTQIMMDTGEEKMPNARDSHSIAKHRILVLGDTGSGKTTQFLTLPGKKFAYLFDPNALLSIRGQDVDYEEFLPDQLSLAVKSLKTSGADRQAVGDKGHGALTSDLYLRWEQDFEKRLQEGFFEDYDVLALDSATTLLDMIMDRVLSINGRFGQWPNQDDYGPQMLTFTNICRSLTSMGKTVYMTGHLDMRQDDLTKRIFRSPMMTGRLKTKIPLLFSDVFVAEAETDQQGKVNYKLQTTPDRMTTNIRTSIKGLDPFENVTIDWTKPVEGQGLGGLLNWEAKQLEGK